MSEKEKMLNGDYYNPMDIELRDERFKAKTLCYEYNKLAPIDELKRIDLIECIFNRKVYNCKIEPNFFCDYGYNIEIKDNFYSNHNLVLLDANKIIFGSNVFVGPNCGFYTPIHPFEKDKRNKGLEKALPIIVEDNVWIGGNVTVLAGVTIGENSVIGAGSVVTKNIPKNSVAVGNPCKVIRRNK